MSDEKPLVQVVSGSPTPEEIAAIVTVVAAMSADDGPAPTERTDLARAGGWKSYWRHMRMHTPVGPGGWRTV